MKDFTLLVIFHSMTEVYHVKANDSKEARDIINKQGSSFRVIAAIEGIIDLKDIWMPEFLNINR